MGSQRRGAGRGHDGVTAETILDTAARIIEIDGLEAFSMRGLAGRLGVAVTSIYWHVGSRDTLFDALADRLLDEMTQLLAVGDTPVDRIASLARAQRTVLLRRQQLFRIAYERERIPRLFLPVQRAVVGLLAEVGMRGAEAALVLRSVEVHVVASAVLQFSTMRDTKHDEEDPSLWTDAWPDRDLVRALQAPTDYDAVFEHGLEALLAPLRTR
jgi:TetR/AcrR family transcriptional regulator, tetracycline repressor protein